MNIANEKMVSVVYELKYDDADAQLIFTTVEEEVLSGLENRGLEADDVVKRLEDIMKLTNIEHLRYRSGSRRRPKRVNGDGWHNSNAY